MNLEEIFAKSIPIVMTFMGTLLFKKRPESLLWHAGAIKRRRRPSYWRQRKETTLPLAFGQREVYATIEVESLSNLKLAASSSVKALTAGAALLLLG